MIRKAARSGLSMKVVLLSVALTTIAVPVANSQSIPPGDSFYVTLPTGNTQYFGCEAALLCGHPDPYIPSSRMRFWRSATISGPSKELAASYVIYAPLVSEVVTVLTPLEFPLAQGDRVIVYACGCVQTGGTGGTWKSYVHPLGNNASRLYSGTIQFLAGPLSADFLIHPTGMQKIADFINAQGNGFIVPNNNTSLSLGYLDDSYSDNGYYRHDNGNDDQCKDVGPAALEVAVFHAGTQGGHR